MNTEFLTQRTHLIQKMASLPSMEHGSLKAEYRTSSAGGQTCQVGPYYKHQVWQNGRNVSQRISAQEAPGLQAAIANRQRFEALAAQFVDSSVGALSSDCSFPVTLSMKIDDVEAIFRNSAEHRGALVLRDTDRSSVMDDLNSVLDAHTRIRYGDIGYHFMIDYAGRVWEGRPVSIT